MEKEHKLSEEEKRQVAHYIAQRSINSIGPEEPKRATRQYLKTFDKVLDAIEEYYTTDQ